MRLARSDKLVPYCYRVASRAKPSMLLETVRGLGQRSAGRPQDRSDAQRFAENRIDLSVLSRSFGKRTRPWLA
jgi:hypothetical protein